MKSNRMDVFTLLVDNEFGVLTRITALIRRAGWNIRSLAVAETAVPEVSRLTICLECRHHTLEQVLERLGKLNCVQEITLFSTEDQVARELCLLRMKAEDEATVEQFVNQWDAQVIGEGDSEVVLSVCCLPQEIDSLLEEYKDNIRDIARTGTIAIRLGEKEGV